MAIGFCLLMGFHIPLNFDAPYLAESIQKFWRRWHISLSSFLRDYLYIPLGGSRGRGELSVARNLMITFLLGGLWHGAGWTFIAWGGLHGMYLTVERWGGRWMAGLGLTFSGPVAAVLRRVAVWHLVCFSWLFFRCVDFDAAREMMRGLTRWGGAVEKVTAGVLLMLVAGYLSQLLDGDRCEKAWDRFGRWHPALQGVLAAAVLMVILGLGPKGVAPFIYFQF
jgi:D-alanyl-lipoteichoic acid acyltransferase DltB (MBOAT superfamily)